MINEDGQQVDFIWKEPPAPEEKPPLTKLARVKAALDSEPGRWMQIHSGIVIVRWWAPLLADRNYERSVQGVMRHPVPREDVYIRRRADRPPAPSELDKSEAAQA